ncbi:antirestriction protein ArdA, partial [Bacteroides sp. AF35-22]|uniref:antirestriction protein ArdA n=1 Tax=Bacteroides sp. AF35-22 TaxID=2292932 RepID=UPI000EBE697F
AIVVYKGLIPVVGRILTYRGQYDDEEDFAYEIIEECYDLPEFAKTYFDYEKFARDLFMCDYWFDDGFVFRAA